MNKNDARRLLELINRIEKCCINISTGKKEENIDNYSILRELVLVELNKDKFLKKLIPDILYNRDEEIFWQSIKNKFSSYSERRNYIYNEFKKISQYIDDVLFSQDKNSPFINVELSTNALFTNEDIIKQIKKAKVRIDEMDYDGAITIAETLLESVFLYLDKKINNKQTINPKEDLLKQYSCIKSMLNLDPSQKKLSDSLKQILQGLSSIVCGLSFIRNKMSDAHSPQYKANRHHAILAVNSANTLAQFLFDTYMYQYDN